MSVNSQSQSDYANPKITNSDTGALDVRVRTFRRQ